MKERRPGKRRCGMRTETKPSRYFPHTHKTMLAAICIASALARRSAPERPAWSSRDDLPAPFLILPGPPARSKCLVCDFGQSHTSAPRFKESVRNISLSYRLGRGAQPLFINRSRTVQFARESREIVRVVCRVEGHSPNRRRTARRSATTSPHSSFRFTMEKARRRPRCAKCAIGSRPRPLHATGASTGCTTLCG